MPGTALSPLLARRLHTSAHPTGRFCYHPSISHEETEAQGLFDCQLLERPQAAHVTEAGLHARSQVQNVAVTGACAPGPVGPKAREPRRRWFRCPRAGSRRAAENHASPRGRQARVGVCVWRVRACVHVHAHLAPAPTASHRQNRNEDPGIQTPRQGAARWEDRPWGLS